MQSKRECSIENHISIIALETAFMELNVYNEVLE